MPLMIGYFFFIKSPLPKENTNLMMLAGMVAHAKHIRKACTLSMAGHSPVSPEKKQANDAKVQHRHA